MHYAIGTAILMAAVASASGSVCAMDSPREKPEKCVVVNGEKLPADVGGAEVICAAIEAATLDKAPSATYAVEVRVLSTSSLAATVTLSGGNKLPEQRMAVSDRRLNRGSIGRFAEAIGLQIAEASRPKKNG